MTEPIEYFPKSVMPPDLQERMKRPVAAFRHRDFRLFYISLVAAAVGSQIQTTSNLWLIYQLTGSPLHLGLTGLARGIPILVFSLAGGVIADRMDRRRLLMITQAVAGLLSLALALLTATGRIQVWHIYVITLVGSSMNALHGPARNAMIPSLVPKEELLNALSLNSTVWQMSTLIGPALAGACIALFGLPPTYGMDGTAHLVTLTTLSTIRARPMLSPRTQSILKSLVEGVRFVGSQSIILVLLTMDCTATFLGSYRALLPVLAHNLGAGPDGLGLLFSAPAAGSLLGSAVLMSLGNVRYKGLFVIGGIIAYCLCLLMLAASTWFPLSLLAASGLGFFDSVQAIPRNAVIQLITPDGLRGRVSSFQRMMTNGIPALGQAQSGAVAALLGAPLALTAGALTCAAIILGLLATRRDLRAADL